MYITVIHDSPELKIKNFNSLINSLYANTIGNFETNYFAKAVQVLNKTVDKLILDLEEYGAKKLGIRIEGDNCYSLTLRKRIIFS